MAYTDIAWTYGGDIVLTSTGDWALLIDSFEESPASEQFLVRLSNTGPLELDGSGNVINLADDIFDQTWGVGLPRYLGEEINQQQKLDIVNKYAEAFNKADNLASNPAPIVQVYKPQNNEAVVTITAATTAGSPAVVTVDLSNLNTTS